MIKTFRFVLKSANTFLISQHKYKRIRQILQIKIMQRGDVNHAMHDLRTQNTIFILIFGLINETNQYKP